VETQEPKKIRPLLGSPPTKSTKPYKKGKEKAALNHPRAAPPFKILLKLN
jgi:hypothetical protein